MYKVTKVNCDICTKPYTIGSFFGLMPQEIVCPECYTKGVARCYYCGWLGYSEELKKEGEYYTCPKCTSFNID